MNIIDYTYFYGKLSLPQTDNTEGRSIVNQFITTYETEFLKKALGFGLWKTFIAGIPGGVVGAEQITNGSFTGNATGWTLGAGWAYGSNMVSFTAGAVTELKQNIGMIAISIPRCRVSFNVGGTTGFVVVSLGRDGTNQVYDAGSGVVTFDGICASAVGDRIIFTPSPDFNGSVDDVSLKPLAVEQRWVDLLEGKEFTYYETLHKWGGFSNTLLQSPIANYVYYRYMENKATDNTLVGTTVQKVDNNARVNSVQKMIDAWNSMVDMNQNLWRFLNENKSTYPEWKAYASDWVSWLSYYQCQRSEVFHKKNSLDL